VGWWFKGVSDLFDAGTIAAATPRSGAPAAAEPDERQQTLVGRRRATRFGA